MSARAQEELLFALLATSALLRTLLGLPARRWLRRPAEKHYGNNAQSPLDTNTSAQLATGSDCARSIVQRFARPLARSLVLRRKSEQDCVTAQKGSCSCRCCCSRERTVRKAHVNELRAKERERERESGRAKCSQSSSLSLSLLRLKAAATQQTSARIESISLLS